MLVIHFACTHSVCDSKIRLTTQYLLQSNQSKGRMHFNRLQRSISKPASKPQWSLHAVSPQTPRSTKLHAHHRNGRSNRSSGALRNVVRQRCCSVLSHATSGHKQQSSASPTAHHLTAMNSYQQITDSSLSSPLPHMDFLAKYQLAVPKAISTMSSNAELTALPEHYHPTEYDVVCGRGKGSYNQPGNKRLRALIRGYIPEYTAARSKFDKTTVLSKIIDAVKSQNNNTARFVKSKNGVWYEISNDQAREKVGHTMRETIAVVNSAARSSDSTTSSEASADGSTAAENSSALLLEGFVQLRRCSKLSQLKQAQLSLSRAA